MEKMLKIDNCGQCKHCERHVDPTTGICIHPNSNRNFVVPCNGLHMFCPLPDAAPAPYSAENPPRVGDVVQVDHYAMSAQVHAIEEGMIQVKGPRANGWWPLGELTFLFRPPSGDTP